MTQVGHILTGAAIGMLCKPDRRQPKWLLTYFGVFLLLANIPDLPFKNWGHDRYDISHSIFVNLLLIAVAGIVLSLPKGFQSRIGGWKVMVGGTAAWLSHLLLDSFYNHGYGIAIFWPLSDARLTLPLPWFSVVTEQTFLAAEGLREYFTEFVFYGSFLAVASIIKWASANLPLKKRARAL
ncbi:MAG: metal-dependent hydrolase [Anaerolineae bacterium]|nr:metal-dependent hydrolase [Anaerolineae bacterium]